MENIKFNKVQRFNVLGTTRSSGIRRSESALEGQDIPTAPMNAHIHRTWQMFSGYG